MNLKKRIGQEATEEEKQYILEKLVEIFERQDTDFEEFMRMYDWLGNHPEYIDDPNGYAAYCADNVPCGTSSVPR